MKRAKIWYQKLNFSGAMLFAILLPCVLATVILTAVLLPLLGRTADDTDAIYGEVLLSGACGQMETILRTARSVTNEFENEEWLRPLYIDHLAKKPATFETKNEITTSLALHVAQNPEICQATFSFYTDDQRLFTSNGVFEEIDFLRENWPEKLCYRSFRPDIREPGLTSIEFEGQTYLLFCTPFRDIPNGREKGVLELLFFGNRIGERLAAASEGTALAFQLLDEQSQQVWSYTIADFTGDTTTLRRAVDDGRYTLVMDIPADVSTKTRQMVIPTTLWTLVISMMISIALAWILSRLTYIPIQKVVQKFVKDDTPPVNELAALEQVFDRVLLEKSESETALSQLRPIARQKILTGLLDGTVFLNDDAVQQLENCRICFAYERYNVIALRVPFSVLQKENLPTELTMEVLMEHLSTHLSLSAYVLAEDSDDYRIIVNYDSWNTLQIYLSQVYSSCRDYFQNQEERLVLAGIGQAVFSPEELYQSADQAEMALNVAALNRLAQPMFYKELTDELSYDYYYPMSEELLLSRTVSNGNAENGKVIVQSIIQKNKEKMLMPNCLLMLYMDLSSTVARSGQGLGISTMPVETREIPKDLDSIQEKVGAMIDDICNQIASRHRKLANHTERKMMEFIEQHLFDPSLSVNQIADAFGKSVAYVSALFKEQYGTSYYNYVNKARIMRAIQLMNDEGLDHNTVYPMVGYTNISTFRRNLLKYKKNETEDAGDPQE